MQVEQELTVAFAQCLSCIPSAPPAQPNRQHYTSQLMQHLPSSLQRLSQHQTAAQLPTQQGDSLNAAASRDLQRARTLMMFTQSWRDSQQAQQTQQPSLHPAAQAFVSCWPLVEQALASNITSTAVRDKTAACCTAAVRMHLNSALPALPGIIQASAQALARGSSNCAAWVAPLAAALDQLEGHQLKQVAGTVLAALKLIDSSEAAQRLAETAAADQDPDFTMVCCHHISMYAAAVGLSWPAGCTFQCSMNRAMPRGPRHGDCMRTVCFRSHRMVVKI